MLPSISYHTHTHIEQMNKQTAVFCDYPQACRGNFAVYVSELHKESNVSQLLLLHYTRLTASFPGQPG